MCFRFEHPAHPLPFRSLHAPCTGVYPADGLWAFEVEYLDLVCVEHPVEFHEPPKSSAGNAGSYNCDSHLNEPPELNIVSIDCDVRVVKIALAVTHPRAAVYIFLGFYNTW